MDSETAGDTLFTSFSIYWIFARRKCQFGGNRPLTVYNHVKFPCKQRESRPQAHSLRQTIVARIKRNSTDFFFPPVDLASQLLFIYGSDITCLSFLLAFLGPHPRHMEVPRVGVESEL